MDIVTHELRVRGYACETCAPLVLGTRGSYGTERLRFSFDGWDGLEKIVTFAAGEDGAAELIVPQSGEVDVPHEATARAGRHLLVVRGTARGAEKYTVGILYRVLSRPDAGGGAPQEPTPDALAQYIAETKDDRSAAENAAEQAQQAADRYPVVKDGTWWVWSAEDGDYADTGQPAQGPPGADGGVRAMTNREIDAIFQN